MPLLLQKAKKNTTSYYSIKINSETYFSKIYCKEISMFSPILQIINVVTLPLIVCQLAIHQ